MQTRSSHLAATTCCTKNTIVGNVGPQLAWQGNRDAAWRPLANRQQPRGSDLLHGGIKRIRVLLLLLLLVLVVVMVGNSNWNFLGWTWHPRHLPLQHLCILQPGMCLTVSIPQQTCQKCARNLKDTSSKVDMEVWDVEWNEYVCYIPRDPSNPTEKGWTPHSKFQVLKTIWMGYLFHSHSHEASFLHSGSLQ